MITDTLSGAASRLNPTIAQTQKTIQPENSQNATESFKDTFSQAFAEINNTVNTADVKMAELATGDSKDIHGTMIAMQKAEISLRLMLNVRNKVVSAYREVSRMQI